MKINRNFFYPHVEASLFHNNIRPTQKNGMEAILNAWDARPELTDNRWLAYMLATVYHECDGSMQPIEEYGKGRNLPYGKLDPLTKQIYYGRGFVQLTWKTNYQKFGELLKQDLVYHPELALDIQIATQVMFLGMTQGIFTGKRLQNYFDGTTEDWINARRIINGTDKAVGIAVYAKNFYAAINNI